MPCLKLLIIDKIAWNLQAGFDLSLRMMAPRLLMHREAGTFEELPAHDVAMQSDAVIVLDHGTDLFIWTVRFSKFCRLLCILKAKHFLRLLD